MTTNTTTPNGTKDLRQASICILNKKKIELDKFTAIAKRARDDKEASLLASEASQQITEEWIIISWELEAQLLRDSIETIEKWIIEDSYNW